VPRAQAHQDHDSASGTSPSHLISREAILLKRGNASKTERGYRVLAAVGDPTQLSPLLAVACALAHAQDGRGTLLSVTPDGKRPDWLAVPEICYGVPVNVMVRAGIRAGGAIMAVVRERSPEPPRDTR